MNPIDVLTSERINEALEYAKRDGADSHVIVDVKRNMVGVMAVDDVCLAALKSCYEREAADSLAWAVSYEKRRGAVYASIHLANAVLFDGVANALAGLQRMRAALTPGASS